MFPLTFQGCCSSAQVCRQSLKETPWTYSTKLVNSLDTIPAPLLDCMRFSMFRVMFQKKRLSLLLVISGLKHKISRGGRPVGAVCDGYPHEILL